MIKEALLSGESKSFIIPVYCTDVKTFPLQSYLRDPVLAVSTLFHCVQAIQNEKDKQPKHSHKIR